MRLALILCCTMCSCALSAAETVGPFAWSARSFDPANPQPSTIARDGTTASVALLAGDGSSGVVQMQTWSGDTEAGGRSVDGTNLFTPPGSNAFIGLRKDWMIREGTDGGSGPWIYYTKFQQDTVTILGFADCVPEALDQSHGAGFALEHALPYDRLLLVLPWRWVQGGGSAYQRGDYRGNPPEAGVFAVPAGMSLSQAQADTATWRLAGLDQVLGEIQPHRWSTSFKLEVLGGGRWQVALDIDGDGQRDIVTDSQAAGHKPCPFANLDERSGLIISTRAAMGARGGTVGRTTTNLTYQLTPATMAGGLHAAFYDFTANLRRLPDVSGLEPDVTRVDPVINYPSTRQPWTGLPNTMADTFTSQHTGFLKITQPGTYTLELRSDDGSRLTLNNAVVINNDGLHGMRRRSTTVDLEAGLHPIVIDFFESRGGAGLVFSWTKPGSTNREVVPAAHLVHAQGLETGPVDRRPFTATIHNVVKSSPTIIDGTAWGAAYDVTAQASTLGANPVHVARIGTTNQWFIDLPLNPQAPTNITFAQTGSPTPSTITGSIEWAPLDMHHDETVTIRAGDSIKLQANTFYTDSIQIDADGDGHIDYTGNEMDVFVHQYTAAGEYVAKAYNQDGDEVGSATITVTEIRLPKAIACEVGFKRQATIHTGIHNPEDLFVTVNDPSLVLLERGPSMDNHLRIYLRALKRGSPILYVRQGDTDGPVLASMEIDEFTLDGTDLNNVTVNGETLQAAGFITMKPFIPDIDVVGSMFANKSGFPTEDGKTINANTNNFTLRIDPQTGETVADMPLTFLIPDDEDQFCFNVKFWQENQEPVPVGDESKNGSRCTVIVPVIAFPYQAAGDDAQDQTKVLNVEVHKKGKAHIDHPLVVVADDNGAGPTAADDATVDCPGEDGDKDPAAIVPIDITCAPGTPPAYYDVTIEGTLFSQKIIVIQVVHNTDVAAPDETPDNRTKVGIGESVTCNPEPNVQLTWSTGDGTNNGQFISDIDDEHNRIWIAPDSANDSVTLTASFDGVEVWNQDFSVIIPDGFAFTEDGDSSDWGEGYWGVRGELDIEFQPLDVSFSSCSWNEGDSDGLNREGIYLDATPEQLSHYNLSGKSDVRRVIDESNKGIDNVGLGVVQTAYPQPSGSFEWSIEVNVGVFDSDTLHPIGASTQSMNIETEVNQEGDSTTVTSTVSKQGTAGEAATHNNSQSGSVGGDGDE